MTSHGTLMIFKKRNFTLLEIMVVIAIIAGIAGILIKNVMGSQDEANKGITRATIQQVEESMDMYYLRKKEYPASEDGLQKLVDEKILKDIPKDPWGEALHYMYPGSHDKPYDIWSWGKNKAEGGDDDINNWEKDK